MYYAKYIIKGEKDIKKNHDYTILRQVFDMARDGGDDRVEDKFYKRAILLLLQVRRISSSFWILETSRLRSGKKGKRSTLSHGWCFVSLTATHHLNALYAANTLVQLVSK